MLERTVRLSGKQVATLKTALRVSDKIHRHYKGSGDPSPYPKIVSKINRQVTELLLIQAYHFELIGLTTTRRERTVIRQSLECLIENLENIAGNPEHLHRVQLDIDVGEMAACGVKLGRAAAGQLEEAQRLRAVFAGSIRTAQSRSSKTIFLNT
jgi:hypothetical protein